MEEEEEADDDDEGGGDDAWELVGLARAAKTCNLSIMSDFFIPLKRRPEEYVQHVSLENGSQ